MARKRKRNRSAHDDKGDKRQKVSGGFNGKDPVVKHAVLAQYYPQVYTLREYLLSKLPATSKARRKKIVSVGKKPQSDGTTDGLASFLDSTLIGVLKYKDASPEERLKQWATFSQRLDTSDSNLINLSGTGFSQSEVVDFAIWLLFSKSQAPNGRVQHILCQGFRKDTLRAANRDENIASAIPGIISTFPNSHVTAIKSTPWPRVPSLMGREGERTMIDLILDCGIFIPIQSGRGSYHQLSGLPLSELQVLAKTAPRNIAQPALQKIHQVKSDVLHTPASITFVRNRMLYARAALNARGGVRFGLRHIHVLNRFPYTAEDVSSEESTDLSTVRVMMYIFPRQFGLHNVFTNQPNPRETVQPFKDYTIREDEINSKYSSPSTIKIPKRLRGKAARLVQKLQVKHSRCAYKELLEYYCPISSRDSLQATGLESQSASASTAFKTQASLSTNDDSGSLLSRQLEIPPRKNTMMDYATPTANVSAFCRAVFSKVIPREFWGTLEHRARNEFIFYQNVDRFVVLRRFESLSLHQVSQGIKIANLEWLGPQESAGYKLSHSDFSKRLEIFHEFIYYIFDSILIPLIRGNFHVTESNIHKYRLFYFRHDVWRSLTEPAIASLKSTMFEEVKLDQARKILESRSLGFSQVRLLPKETGVRPIMNLRRRAINKGYKKQLGYSINSVLAPVHNVLTLEKELKPDRLGSAMFSVGDLYERLKSFKSSLPTSSKSLYFAKVDVKSAFDTIPQDTVLELIASLPTYSEYRISRHAEIKPGDGYREPDNRSKPIRKWSALAHPDALRTFSEDLENKLAVGRKNTIFVENIASQYKDIDDLLSLLTEHVQRNMVKIGKRFYRQKEGIPQGSVISSLLCNYFYADLEVHHLQFIQPEESLLLRLIDDFLLITTNCLHAKQFLQVMHDGLPSYGVRVNPDKTLVNFEAVINGKKVTRLVGNRAFPYCGSFINTESLNITKDRERRKDIAIADSLTVEFSKLPGKTFHHKVLNTFKIQAHAMFLDTSHNSLATVVANIHSAFTETATKMWTYVRCLPKGKRPSTNLLISTVSRVIELAFVLMKNKGKNKKNAGYVCGVSKVQVEWIAQHAFRDVLRKRQSTYSSLLVWIDENIARLKLKEAAMIRRMGSVIRQAV